MQIYIHDLVVIVCPRFSRETEGGRTFGVSSATRLSWNSLPSNLKKEGTLVTSFSEAIRSYFLTNNNEVDHFSLNST